MRLATALVLAASMAAGICGAQASQCKDASYPAAKTRLTTFLSRSGYTTEEIRFLMSEAELNLKEHKAEYLTEAAKPCGIVSARAHILGCIRAGLPELLASTSKPKGSLVAFNAWGKHKLTVRELIFIGKFHGCNATGRKMMMFR